MIVFVPTFHVAGAARADVCTRTIRLVDLEKVCGLGCGLLLFWVWDYVVSSRL